MQRGIFVYHIKEESAQAEALLNFQISLRGSLRKAPHLLQWVAALTSLKKKGYSDPSDLIKRYNTTAPKAQQLNGMKGQAVKNIMTSMTPALIDMLQTHVSKFGWEGGVFSDDALSSKKILPEYAGRAPPGRKTWINRLRMSEKATSLCFSRAITDFGRAPTQATTTLCLSVCAHASSTGVKLLSAGLDERQQFVRTPLSSCAGGLALGLQTCCA